ncbi:MAG TPA: TIM barrel protein, partial [Clostridia bacterium]|nr:TIM barrel protein [Clostridia bacterium]
MARFSVFTKPWKNLTVEELIGTVLDLGYDAIEFPLRDGFQVTPANCRAELPGFAKKLREHDILIDDVASTPTEDVFAACAESGIPMIRIMFSPPAGADFLEEEDKMIRELEGLLPRCKRYGVKVGLQMHCGTGASNTAEMMRIVSRFDPQYIGSIWDAAHSGLAGEVPEQAIDIAWSHLCLVNFKAARYEMRGRTPDGEAEFRPFFCPGADGQSSWPRAVRRLKAKGYAGT